MYEIVREIFDLSLARMWVRRSGSLLVSRCSKQQAASNRIIVGKDDQGVNNVDITLSNAEEILVVSASREIKPTLVLKEGMIRIVTLVLRPVIEVI